MTPRQREIEASRAEWVYYQFALRTAGEPGSWPPPRQEALQFVVNRQQSAA